MKTNFLTIPIFLVACFLMTSCQKDDVSAPKPLSVSTEKVTPRFDCNPCEGDVIFGPETFERTTGNPMNFLRVFEMGEDADVCLMVTNNGVSSARIMIDEEEVFSTKDFNRNVTNLQVTTFLDAGIHQIGIILKGKPGGTITLTLRGCITGPPPELLCSEAARQACVALGWQVVGVYPAEGTLVCTLDGRSDTNNCDSPNVYNIYVWKDGAPEHYCPEDGTFPPYETQAGKKYGGHNPCICGNNLYDGGSWDLQNCVPD